MNSHHIEEIALQVSNDSEWPYSAPAPANYVPRITTDPSQYAYTHVSPHIPTPYAGPRQAIPIIFEALADLSSAPYSTTQARPHFPTNYPSSYNSQHDVQRPIQGPPLHMSQGPTPTYSDYSQQWNPIPSSGRSTTHNILYEQDPSRYETSTVSYMTSSCTSVPNVAAERPPIFPGLSPLVTNGPAHSGNRTLPDPMNIHSSFDSTNGSVQGSDGDGSYQQHLETGTSQESVSSVSQDAISAAGQSSSTASSSPSETQEMPTFPYISMTQASSNAPSENASSFHAMDASTTSNVGSFTTSPNSAFNSQLPSLSSPFNGYVGHRGTHIPDRALEPGMSTRNGNVYDPHGRPRIFQPQPRRSSSYDLLKSSFEESGKPTGKVLKPNGHGRRPDGKR